MNKTVLGILVGLAIGAGAMWLALKSHATSAPPKAEEAAKSEPKKENPLHLPPAKRQAAGITLAKPTEATLTPEVEAFGRVLDPTPFVSLVAEQETARAALAASEKELQRVRQLHELGGNASAQALETAEANAARDRAALASAHIRLLAGWGKQLAETGDLGTLSGVLEKGAALIRLDVLTPDLPAAGVKTARVTLAGGDESWEATIVGPAPSADPQVQGTSFLAVVHDHLLPAGAALRGTLAGRGEAEKALVIPATGVVYHQGSAWVYVLGEEDTFERKIVTTGRRVGEGIVVTGIEAGEQVVTNGAGQLLSAELQAGGGPDEG